MTQVEDCIFCKIVRGELPSTSVYEDEACMAFMDINPASTGHTLIIPKDHAENLLDIPTSNLIATMATTQKIAQAIQQALQPEGMRISQLNGAAAGQMVFHYHVHIIPVYAGERPGTHGRGSGDPQIIQQTAAKIRAALNG
jgi:histidine triad (HIT) family protein